MLIFAWFVRLLAIVRVGYGFATMAFQSRKAADNKDTHTKLVALLVACWCVVAGAALAVLAETYTTVKPQWLATAMVAVESFLWALIMVDFGFRHSNN